MISKLRKIFSSLIIYENDAESFNNDYKWFVSIDQKIIGIKKNELTLKDTSLLNVFLSPYNTDFPVPTKSEGKWEQIIYNENQDEIVDTEITYRFVYFSIKKNQIDPSSFKDAIQELFLTYMPIIWISNSKGIIIEEKDTSVESISYEHIIDILMSDLYVNINFFVGPFQYGLDNVKRYYQMIIKAAEVAFTYSKNSVVTYSQVIPFLFVDQMRRDQREDISKTILQEFISDEETLKTIHVFIECNLNVSETAKELYMHRNSLQYRLDRFYEKTGLDIRQFQDALTVYLALIAKVD